MGAEPKPPAGEWPLAIVLIAALFVGALRIAFAFAQGVARSLVGRARGLPEPSPWSQVERLLRLDPEESGPDSS